MGEFLKFVSREEVYSEYISKLKPIFDVESISVFEAVNRVCSEDVVSDENLPGFYRSNVDGYAVKAEETFGASMEMPAFLKVIGEIKIGEEPSITLNSGEAIRVATGGTIPKGANAVVMVENTKEIGEFVEVYKTVSPWENILREDEDVKVGETIIEKGKRLNDRDIHSLLAIGKMEVKVFKKVRIGIISTGDEIIEPWEKKKVKYQIRDSNTYFLANYLKNQGFEAIRLGHVKDDYVKLLEIIKFALKNHDVVITCGGSSLGTRDYTMAAFSEVGEVIYHGVLIKPGKPTVFGLSKNKVLIGLPGNPTSFVSSTTLFLIPILKKLSGEKDVFPKPEFYVKIDTNVPASQGRERFVMVKLYRENRNLFAAPILGDSGLISTIRRADGMIRIPLGVEGLYKNETCEFYRLLDF